LDFLEEALKFFLSFFFLFSFTFVQPKNVQSLQKQPDRGKMIIEARLPNAALISFDDEGELSSLIVQLTDACTLDDKNRPLIESLRRQLQDYVYPVLQQLDPTI
jgi:hypothetical protein